MHWCFSWMYVHVRVSDLGVTDSCELTLWGLEIELGSSWRAVSHLTTEPPLQPQSDLDLRQVNNLILNSNPKYLPRPSLAPRILFPLREPQERIVWTLPSPAHQPGGPTRELQVYWETLSQKIRWERTVEDPDISLFPPHMCTHIHTQMCRYVQTCTYTHKNGRAQKSSFLVSVFL